MIVQETPYGGNLARVTGVVLLGWLTSLPAQSSYKLLVLLLDEPHLFQLVLNYMGYTVFVSPHKILT